MMTPHWIKTNKARSLTAFTFFELVVVLAIISMMVAIIIPFARRNNDELKITEQIRDMADTIKYALSLAGDQKIFVKFTIDAKNNSYYIQQSLDNCIYEKLEDVLFTKRNFDRKIQIVDTAGFEQNGEEFSLLFDPKSSWPKASISLSTTDTIKIIKIDAKNVQIEETDILQPVSSSAQQRF